MSWGDSSSGGKIDCLRGNWQQTNTCAKVYPRHIPSNASLKKIDWIWTSLGEWIHRAIYSIKTMVIFWTKLTSPELVPLTISGGGGCWSGERPAKHRHCPGTKRCAPPRRSAKNTQSNLAIVGALAPLWTSLLYRQRYICFHFLMTNVLIVSRFG